MRLSTVALMLVIGLTFSLTGCGKVPTWNELTSGQQPAPAATPPATPAVTPVAVQTPAAVPAGPSPEEVIAKFKSLRSAEVSDAAIAQLTSLKEGADQVTEINADGGQVTNAAFNAIGKLTNLRQLRLSQTRVDDAACEKIAELPSLEVLALTDTAVSDVGVARLSGLQNLKYLELVRCRLTERGFDAIGKMPSLVTIMADNTNLDNRKLDLLCNASTLTRLSIGRSTIDDQGLIALKKLGALEVLEIGETQIQGWGLMNAQKAGGLKKLTELIVYHCPLDERGAKAINNMKNLERLNIGNIGVMRDLGFATIVTGMKKLKYVNVSLCPNMDGSGLTALKGCNDLEEIHIDQCPLIGDGVIKILKNFKNLKLATTGGTAITPRGRDELKSAAARMQSELNSSSQPEIGVPLALVLLLN